MSVELLNVNLLLYHPVDLLEIISMKCNHPVTLHTTQTNVIISAIPGHVNTHTHTHTHRLKEKEQIYYTTDKEMDRKRV